MGLCVLGTMTTRFLPFLVFRENRETPKFIQYVGNFLPSAVFGMLVVLLSEKCKCIAGTHGIPEFISILITAGLHIWKRQMLVSIAGGTICYILLLHFC
ncbi:MAG: branched-chain amino acid transporter permease [Anaerobutyricum sp.]